jgi:hypothetical protein
MRRPVRLIKSDATTAPDGKRNQTLQQAEYSGKDSIGSQSGHQREQPDVDKSVTDAHACQQDEGGGLPREGWNQRDG